jgi:hypothetical protein
MPFIYFSECLEQMYHRPCHFRGAISLEHHSSPKIIKKFVALLEFALNKVQPSAQTTFLETALINKVQLSAHTPFLETALINKVQPSAHTPFLETALINKVQPSAHTTYFE